MPNTNRFVPLLLTAACALSSSALAERHDEIHGRASQIPGLLGMEGVRQWFERTFSEDELHALRANDLAVTAQFCNCDDRPTAHYPYVMMLLATPKGDLIARLERNEMSTRVVQIAVRNGNAYCSAEEGEGCYGSFAHACEFTDHRYGATLAPFFPECKDGPSAPR